MSAEENMHDYRKFKFAYGFNFHINHIHIYFYRSRHDAREIAEDELRPGSPPLELRTRTAAMPLQSPSDRITGK
jgi:hypothetical protein